jgi:hypothetical protein
MTNDAVPPRGKCPTCKERWKWSEATAVAAYNNQHELCHDPWHLVGATRESAERCAEQIIRDYNGMMGDLREYEADDYTRQVARSLEAYAAQENASLKEQLAAARAQTTEERNAYNEMTGHYHQCAKKLLQAKAQLAQAQARVEALIASQESFAALRVYFLKRAIENKKRAGIFPTQSPGERWHSAKYDTYERCADKLDELIRALKNSPAEAERALGEKP